MDGKEHDLRHKKSKIFINICTYKFVFCNACVIFEKIAGISMYSFSYGIIIVCSKFNIFITEPNTNQDDKINNV